MDRDAVFNYGVDIVVHFAIYDTSHFHAWNGIYFGGGTVLFIWGHILCLAPVKVQPCNLAPVRYWGKCVLFLCGAVWVNYRLSVDWLVGARLSKNRRDGGFLFSLCLERQVIL
jgi:hypothetical protein